MNTVTIATAVRLLRNVAKELQQSHTTSINRDDWEREPDAKAAYDEHMAAAAALEAMPAAMAVPVEGFEFWWSDHMPKSTQNEAWASWVALHTPHVQYRLLTPADEIEAEDEFLQDDCSWMKDGGVLWTGTTWTPWMRPARRVIAKAAQQGGDKQ